MGNIKGTTNKNADTGSNNLIDKYFVISLILIYFYRFNFILLKLKK